MKMKPLMLSAVLTWIVLTPGFELFGQTSSDADKDYDSLTRQVDALLQQESYAQAISLLEQMHKTYPDNLAVIEYLGILFTAQLSERPGFGNALPYLLEAEKRYSADNSVYYDLACAYSVLGKTDAAVQELEKSVYFGFADLESIRTDDDMTNLRKTATWRAIAGHESKLDKALRLLWQTGQNPDKASIDDQIATYRSVLNTLAEFKLPNSLIMALSYIDLGNAYFAKGEYDQAIAYCQRGLSIQLKALGAGHPDAALSYNRLGMAYDNQGDYDKALEQYQQALAIWIKALGPADSLVAVCYNNLGITFANKRDYPLAIKNYDQALSIRLKILGPDHPDVAMGYDNLGQSYAAMGNYDKSIGLSEQALAIRIKVLGPDHPDVATCYNNLGLAYHYKGDYEKAIGYTEQALAIWIKALGADHLLVANAFNNLAQGYCEIGDYARALSYQEKSLSIQMRALGPGHPEMARGYNNLATTYLRTGVYDKAISYQEQALAVWIKALGPDHPDVATGYNNLGQIYEAMGDYDKAIGYQEQALAIWIKALGPDHPQVALSYNNLGLFYHGKGDYGKSIDFTEKALSLRIKALGPEHPDVAKSYNNLGQAYLAKGDYDKAISYQEQALAIWIKTLGADHPDVARSYNNLGQAYQDKGDYDKAISYQEQALAIWIKALGADHTDVAVGYNNLGLAWYSEGDYEKAVNYQEKALAIWIKALGPEHPNIAKCYNNLGGAYQSKGDYDRAISYLEKALAISAKTLGPGHPVVAVSYNNLGVAYQSKGDNGKAIEFYKKAMLIWQKSTVYQETLGQCWVLARGFLDEDPIFALQADLVGIETVERARLDLGSAKTGILARSLPLYYAGVDLEIRNGNPGQAFEYSEALRSRGFLDQMGQETALRLDGITDDERLKIHALSSRIEDLRSELERLNNLPLDKRDPAVIVKIGAGFQSAEKELADLNDSLGKRLPRYSQLRNPKPVDQSTAQAWCGKDRMVLEYVLWDPTLETALNSGGDQDSNTLKQTKDGRGTRLKSYCLVLGSEGVKSFPLDADFDYESAINELRGNILNQRNPSKFEAVRNTLYQKLIMPVLDSIPSTAKEVVIVPDGALAFLPFDILRPSAMGDDFGTQYAISLSPSVSVSVMAQSSASAAGTGALTLGGAWYDPEKTLAERGSGKRGYTRSDSGDNPGYDSLDEEAGLNQAQREAVQRKAKEEGAGAYFAERGFHWSDLPGTEQEIENLGKKVFTVTKPTVLSGDQASESNLKRLSSSGALKEYPFIHLACHGYFDSLVPEMSCVVLSEVSGLLKDDAECGYLTVPDIALLSLGARMVSLSACETGLTKVKRGDGMVGLTRAFLVAGTQAVGVSLWSVDDEATATFMVRLYTKVVNEGMSFRDAYRVVKDEFRKDPKWNHPFYWAAFTMYE